MNVGLGAPRETFEEVGHKFGLQVSDQSRPHFGLNHRGAASAEINRDDSQRFVHGHHEISRPKDAALAAQRLRKRLAESNTHILHCVVLIDVKIAAGFEIQIKRAVTRQQLQHLGQGSGCRCRSGRVHDPPK